jgi:hypothetical protein
MRAHVTALVGLGLLALPGIAQADHLASSPLNRTPYKLGSISKSIRENLHRTWASQVDGYYSGRMIRHPRGGPVSRAAASLGERIQRNSVLSKLTKPNPVRPWKSSIPMHPMPW